MLKLYRRLGEEVCYWEAWVEDLTLVVHSGKLGEIGSTREVQLGSTDPEAVIVAESRIPRSQGYEEIGPGELVQLVVQHRVSDMSSHEDLDWLARVEDLLNESLGWTGNGHCDGHDMGSGTANVFCYVVDPEIARRTIVGTLEEIRRLNDAVIALRSKSDEYVVVWPLRYKDRFQL